MFTKGTVVGILSILCVLIIFLIIIHPTDGRSRIQLIQKQDLLGNFTVGLSEQKQQELGRLANGLIGGQLMAQGVQPIIYSPNGMYKISLTATMDEKEEDAFTAKFYNEFGKEVWTKTTGGAITISNNGRNFASALKTSPNCDLMFCDINLQDYPINALDGCYDSYLFSGNGDYFVAFGERKLVLCRADGQVIWSKLFSGRGNSFVRISDDGKMIALVVTRISKEAPNPELKADFSEEKTGELSDKTLKKQAKPSSLPLRKLSTDEEVVKTPITPTKYRSFILFIDSSGSIIAQSELNYPSIIDAVFSPGNGDFLCVSAGNSILLVESKSGSLRWDSKVGTINARTTSIAFMKNLSQVGVCAIDDIASSSSTRSTYLLNFEDGTIVNSFAVDDNYPSRTSGVKIAFDKEGRYLLALTPNKKYLYSILSR